VDIRFSGAITKQEFLDAARLASHPVHHRQSLTFDISSLFLFVATIFGVLGIWQLGSSRPVSLVLLFFAMVFAVLGLKARSIPSQAWEGNEEIKAVRQGRATDEALEISSPYSQSRQLWSAFAGYGIFEDVLILSTHSAVFIPFSKRLFSAADWDQFLQFLSVRLPRTHLLAAGAMPAFTLRNLLAGALLLLILIILVLRGGQ